MLGTRKEPRPAAVPCARAQVSALDLPTCGEISREDAFRFLTEVCGCADLEGLGTDQGHAPRSV